MHQNLKMKIINLTFLFLIGSWSLIAQDEIQLPSEVKITKSEPYPVVDALSKMYLKIDNNNVLAVKIQGKKQNKFVFQVLSGENLNLKSSKTELMDEPGFNFEYIMEIADKHYFFYSVYDKPNSTEQLFVRTINTSEGGFSDEAKLLVTVDKKLSGSYYYKYAAQGKFRIDVSSDRETFVIKYRHNPEEKDDSKNTDIIGMHVFDKDLNPIWNNDFTMPYTESMMDNLDFAVDSHGNGYFLIRKFEEEVSRKNSQDPENQSLAILITSPNGELNEVEFDLGENLIDNVIMKENKKGDIICAGYYRKPKSYGVDGTFVSILDSKGNLSNPKFYEFSLDFIKQYRRVSERSKKKMEKAEDEGKLSINNLYMSRVVVLEDGGIVISGEIFYVTCTTDSKGNTHCVNHYDDVIVVKINADGELGWMQKYFKRSTTESFDLFASEKYTYVLFLDALRNASMTDDGEITDKVKGDYVTAHRIDNASGERKFLPLFDRKVIDGVPVYQYRLNRVIPIDDNSFAIELYIKKKSDMMFKVEFEE